MAGARGQRNHAGNRRLVRTLFGQRQRLVSPAQALGDGGGGTVVTLDDDEIYRLMEEIWSTMLSLELERPEHQAPDHTEHGTLTGCVHISGAWEGAAVLSCSTELAQQVTKIMFGAPEVSG